jgi:hypothetical protein
MITQAYFEDIQENIARELRKANQSILLAVAWFTDRELFDILCNKARANLKVEILLMNDQINAGRLDYARLQRLGGNVHWAREEDNPLMHNKFCVIDGETVITGSYNWTFKAKSNEENIVITKEDDLFAREFADNFFRLKRKYTGQGEQAIDYGVISKRMEKLKGAIELRDEDDIDFEIKKIYKSFPESSVPTTLEGINQILALVKQKAYSEAMRLLLAWLDRYKALTIYQDPEINALRLEIYALELQISSLQDEKSEIEKNIRTFEIKHNHVLGEIILKILDLRKLIAIREAENSPQDESKKQAEKEAKQDYKQYQDNYKENQDKALYELSLEEQRELKANYRKASKLCHPDAVGSEYAEEAAQVFVNLQKAYNENDIAKVNELLKDLQTGKPFKAKHESLTEKEKLQKEMQKLREILTNLVQTSNALKNSEVYQKISKIADIESYLAQEQTTLQEILAQLQNQYKDGK